MSETKLTRPDWKSWKDGWRRSTAVVPGHDNRKVGGGIHCADWWYVVSDGECALSLLVFSNRYDGTLDACRPAEGAYLRLHFPWPIEVASIRNGGVGSKCMYTETGLCFGPESSCTAADELFKEHGVDALEQPESFWNALRAKAVEWIADARAKRKRLEHVLRCPTCAGRGMTGADSIEED